MKWVSARGQQAAFRIGAGWDGGGKEKRLKAGWFLPPPLAFTVVPPLKRRRGLKCVVDFGIVRSIAIRRSP